MPIFDIDYKKISYYTCRVEAQNESQVRYLYEHNQLDLDGERFGDSELGDLIKIEKRPDPEEE
jgi:hypothetical protein